MKEVTWKDRLRYQFDNYMAKGTVALIGGLAALSLVIIIIAGFILSVGGKALAPEGSTESLTFIEATWESLMRTLDAGTMGGDSGWGFRMVMFAVTLGGVFIISSLIGVLTSGVEGKMEDLRKGRSRVIENNHTVILGWSPLVFSIISELTLANENRKDACIVVLGEKDKVEMEDEIREMIDVMKTTRVVCRTGASINPNDLEITNLQTARSIIILSPEKDNPDADVIKTMLAITNAPDRRKEPYHIVAEIRDPKNLEIAKIVGKDEVELVLVGDLISRIIAQTCRQSGLSIIYTELLDFGGDEIYFKEEPELVGKTFGEAILAYEDSNLMGLFTPGEPARLNPPMETIIQPGDQMIVISADDDTIHLSGKTDLGIRIDAINERVPAVQHPERTLILGWNWRATTIINELDNYVAPGSVIEVVANKVDGEAEIARFCPDLKNQALTYHLGDTTDRRTLDSLGMESYDHIIVLSYSDTLEPQESDSITLITLLHLRDMAQKSGRDFPIVSEMQDLRNRNLAEITEADDFIVSDKLISLMLAQVSENKYLNAVFVDIFDPDGSEIYLKPASNYVETGTAVNFYTIVEAARRRNEVAMGYRLEADSNNPAKSYGVVVNPEKSVPITFGEQDRIIVLAEG